MDNNKIKLVIFSLFVFILLFPLTRGAECTAQIDPNYHKNVDNPAEVCQFNCINGVVVAQNCRANECLNCDGICSNEYECIGGTLKSDTNQESLNNIKSNDSSNYVLLAVIIASGIIIVGIIVAWVLSKKKK